jgi:DNA helicase HerA-like ATPase
MHTDLQAARVTVFPANDRPAEEAAEPLGHVVSVGGSQVIAQFTADISSSGDDRADVTVGTFLGVVSRHSLVIGVLCDITLDRSAGGKSGTGATARVDLVGEILFDKSGRGYFQRGVMVYPKIGSAVVAIGSDELQLIFDVAGENTINVGQLQQDASLGAYVNVDQMVRKHFAIFGSTGAGKSSGVAVIVREIMQARGDLRMLLIDPHNEYGHCYGDRAHVVRPGNLNLPYWLFNFEEIVEVIFGRQAEAPEEIALLADLIPLAKAAYAPASRPGERTPYRQVAPEAGRYTVDTPVPYRMEDLITLAEGRMGKLENGAFALHYQRLVTRLNTVRRNPRYAFIFDGVNAESDTMVDVLCKLLRLDDDGRPITVLQLAGFPVEVFDPMVSVLFRLAFEFGLWSDGALPLLIVCEEAHNYANADRTIGFRPARQALSRIAKEGRKYGVFLGLISQRPAQIDPTLISQCSTVFALRMANEDDQKIVHAAVSDPANRFLGFLASLGTREALAFGAGVPVATRLSFKQLPEGAIPKSEAVRGGRVDAGAKVDRHVVASVVARWRGTATNNKVQEQTRMESIFLTR